MFHAISSASLVVAFLCAILIAVDPVGRERTDGLQPYPLPLYETVSFAKERELRVVQCHDPIGGANRHYDLNNFAQREPLYRRGRQKRNSQK